MGFIFNLFADCFNLITLVQLSNKDAVVIADQPFALPEKMKNFPDVEGLAAVAGAAASIA